MKVCIIVPCYNEEKRLHSEEFISFSKKHEIDFLFVNDGSTDKTNDILKNISEQSDKIETLSLPKNEGKAEAVRIGMYTAANTKKYDFVGFIDSDLATPLNELNQFIKCLRERPHFKMIMGIRIKRLGSMVERNLSRHYLGRAFATFVSLLLKLPTYDTQCGAKLIDSNIVNQIFQEQFVSPWFFDVEIIFRIQKKMGKEFAIKNIYEFPIFEWKEIEGSKIKLKHYFLAPLELLKIKLKYR